jgi:ketosteroid isomerase-like protein
MTTETTAIPAEVMAVLEAWGEALRKKDLDALARCYADDVLVFDIGAQTVG